MTYDEIYRMRLKRFGNNRQERVQNKREREFEAYWRDSVYKVEFDFNGPQPGVFEPLSQGDSETRHYLLTRIGLEVPAGTILFIPNDKEVLKPWLVMRLEEIKASGYNRYTMLKMTHFLQWVARDGSTQSSWAYFHGKGHSALKDQVKSSTGDVVYKEDSNENYFIFPRNEFLKKEDYFSVGEEPFREHYRVTGYDIQSTPGVEYVTVDPIFEYDQSPMPEKTDNDNNFFWLEGGE